jgi:hypothetical protein
MISHFLDLRFTVGGEVDSLTRWQRVTHRKIFWYSFLLDTKLQIHEAAERKQYNNFIRTPTLDLAACSIAPQSYTLPFPPHPFAFKYDRFVRLAVVNRTGAERCCLHEH